ncbi:hypothetical protein ACFWUZ_18055 [Streptomyces sp. NPDC058646]|uniref:hypothetical protein n=1 Tax=Streptomyces sp. NPDC058646 TaxID=3346574 RepID=UPI00364C2352
MHGELTACGVSRPVFGSLRTVAPDDKRITASGTAMTDRYAFGVTKGKGMTGRHLKITVEVVAHLPLNRSPCPSARTKHPGADLGWWAVVTPA